MLMKFKEEFDLMHKLKKKFHNETIVMSIFELYCFIVFCILRTVFYSVALESLVLPIESIKVQINDEYRKPINVTVAAIINQASCIVTFTRLLFYYDGCFCEMWKI